MEKVHLSQRVERAVLKLLGVYYPDERERWIVPQIKAIEPGKKILDAGCGWQVLRPFCDHLDYRGQDFAQYDGSGDGEGSQISTFFYGELDYVGDIWDIDEEDNTFDAILCTDVMEHIPFPNETFAELVRLLKPGGVLLVTAPFKCSPHMTPYFFYTGFSRQWYEHMANTHSLELEALDGFGEAYSKMIFETLRNHAFFSNPFVKYAYLGLSTLLVIPLFMVFRMFKNDSEKDTVFGLFARFKKPEQE
jgi:SAM-dependent methyltransferase